MLIRPGAVRDALPAGGRGGDEAEAMLLARIVERDLRAFEQLYRIYRPRLGRFLHSMLRRPQLVEEALDDTLMVVWRRAERFNGARVSTWIFAIAYRTALKALRGSDDPREDPDAEARPSEGDDPETALARKETRTIVLEALDTLSADHRAVVHLTYYREAGYREIAEIMSCPVDTVKTRMFHARRKLKAALAGRLPDPH